jgi:hypothetical protein
MASGAMTKLLILGANGQLARNTTRFFLEKTDVALTAMLIKSGGGRSPAEPVCAPNSPC